MRYNSRLNNDQEIDHFKTEKLHLKGGYSKLSLIYKRFLQINPH